MADIKLKVGGRYLTRNGRVTMIEKRSGNSRFCFVGRVEGDNLERGWTESGQWGIDPGETLDLVSEYVEPAAAANEPRYRYFRYAEPDRDPHYTCVWRHAAGDRYCTAKYIYRGNDDWEETGICLEDNLTDPDVVECDENGVPLATQPAADAQPLEPGSTPAVPILTELDVFAVAALPAYLTHLSSQGHSVSQYYREIATESYNIAEALLAESRIRNGGAR